MSQDCEKTIWGTILYFSFFGYPLTAFECYKWQYAPERPYPFEEITSCLQTSAWLRERVLSVEGYYGIGDVNKQVQERKDRYVNAVKKQKKADRVVRFLSRLPWVEGVAFCNSLPMHFTREKSDIDLFVLTKRHSVWKTRLFAVLPMMLLRQRPGERVKDPVDLSFFVAPSARNLQPLRLGAQDRYLAYWTAMLSPVFEREPGVFAGFFLQNDWVKQLLPQLAPTERPEHKRISTRRAFPIVFPEVVARILQRFWFPKDIREAANRDTRILVRDDMLKFHKNDRRQEIMDYMETHLA